VTEAGKWDNFNALKYADQEQQEAHKEVAKAKDIVPKHRGPNSYVDFGSRDRKPLNGCTQRQSDILRHVNAFRYSGYTLREGFEDAARKFDIEPITAENTWYHNPEGQEMAEKEHLEKVLAKYHMNLVRVTNMLSDAAPLAVETLTKVMKSTKASPNVKASAAKDIIKLSKIADAPPPDRQVNPALESLRLVRDITEAKEGNSHLVDIEDAEIVEEDESAD
jgi:hypothetical protein